MYYYALSTDNPSIYIIRVDVLLQSNIKIVAKIVALDIELDGAEKKSQLPSRCNVRWMKSIILFDFQQLRALSEILIISYIQIQYLNSWQRFIIK